MIWNKQSNEHIQLYYASPTNVPLSVCIHLHTHTHKDGTTPALCTFFFFPAQYQSKNEVASVIGHPITQFCCSLIRWPDRWLIALGRWHCSPSLCWCVGGMASHTPISTAASSPPWRSLMFWSLLSKRGVGKYAFIFGFCYGGWHTDLDLSPSPQEDGCTAQRTVDLSGLCLQTCILLQKTIIPSVVTEAGASHWLWHSILDDV